MHEYTIVLPARLHRDELRREVAQIQRAAQAQQHPARARLAGVLVALAARLAPAGQDTPARQSAESRQPA